MAQHEFEAFYYCAVTSDRIGAHTAAGHIRLGGDGSLGVALSQALRAKPPSQTTARPTVRGLCNHLLRSRGRLQTS
jgi:hypothetical protein